MPYASVCTLLDRYLEPLGRDGDLWSVTTLHVLTFTFAAPLRLRLITFGGPFSGLTWSGLERNHGSSSCTHHLTNIELDGMALLLRP